MIYNGMKDIGGFANAHISLFGRSIIVDYEHCLHGYCFYKDLKNNCVPCEMYPYDGDVIVFQVPIDKEFQKVNILQLVIKAIWLIIKEKFIKKHKYD